MASSTIQIRTPLLTPMMPSTNTASKITFLQWNINGLRSKLATLHLVLAEQRVDVLLQETLRKSSLSIAN